MLTKLSHFSQFSAIKENSIRGMAFVVQWKFSFLSFYTCMMIVTFLVFLVQHTHCVITYCDGLWVERVWQQTKLLDRTDVMTLQSSTTQYIQTHNQTNSDSISPHRRSTVGHSRYPPRGSVYRYFTVYYPLLLF